MTMGQRVLWLLVPVAYAFLLSGSFAIACDEKFAVPIASNVSQELSTVGGFSQIACQAVSEEPKCAILCISDLDLTAYQRKAVLVFITASVGSQVRAYDVSRFSNIIFADRGLVSAGRFLQLSASRASELQQTLAANRTPPLVLLNQIAAEYIETPVQ